MPESASSSPVAPQRLRVLRADRNEHRIVVAPQIGEREIRSPARRPSGTRRRARGSRRFRRRGRPSAGGRPGCRTAACRPAPAAASNSVHRCPFCCRNYAAASPAGPAPTIATCWPVDGARGGTNGRGAAPIHVGGVAMQRADRQALVVLAAPAVLLAQPRADPAERAGQREALGDDLHRRRAGCRRLGDLAHERRDVEHRRTRRGARRDALAGVIGEQQLERHAGARARTSSRVGARRPCRRPPASRRRATASGAPRPGPRRRSTRRPARSPSTWQSVGIVDAERPRRLQHGRARLDREPAGRRSSGAIVSIWAPRPPRSHRPGTPGSTCRSACRARCRSRAARTGGTRSPRRDSPARRACSRCSCR